MNVLLLVLIGIGIFVFMPLAGIWALNTLFGLAIGYTWQTWVAVVILTGFIGGTNCIRK